MLAMVCWYNILDIYYIINLRNIRLLSKVQSYSTGVFVRVYDGITFRRLDRVFPHPRG